ncbi:MAG: glycoside hydrolase family 88 protein [Bacteroidota bacterium]|nr:glycoside hydrolase family 88 protein [Bacteroidota bacterium]
MKKYLIHLIILALCPVLSAQLVSKQKLRSLAEESALQYHVLKSELNGSAAFPQTYDKAAQKLVTSNSGWWCSGFYPGSLFYLYELTGDTVLYQEANRLLVPLAKEQFNVTTHDLGFMMYCSFGNANRLHATPEYKQTLLNSARSLASRFNPTVGCIKSWDSKPGDFLVIIDNMMNLELLFWATKVTGDSTYAKIAITHANTTMKNHFRPDYSSYHVINYNPQTGVVQQKRTAQGYSDGSAWARGQAWGLYGFTVMYRETHNPKYLKQAMHIAGFILHHPRLPKDMVPYWDFDAPNIPMAPRDASAAAVMCSALLELQQYAPRKLSETYLKAAETMFNSLSSDIYRAKPGKTGGFILDHSTGNLPNHSEVDVPLSYADYYYLEAMKRMKDRIYN